MHYLALDQGGHASRALVLDDRGRIIATGTAPITTQHPGPGQVEHDPEEVVGSLHQAIAGACTSLPAGSRLAAAGLATQRSSMVCWRRDGSAALSPVLSWQDTRNAGWLKSLEPEAARIRALTGLVLSPHYGASKMRWCLDHLPAVQAAARSGLLVMGPLASFLLCRLLNEAPVVADPANASRTQLWNPASRSWSPELLALFGVDQRSLPGCVTSRHTYGTLATPVGPVPLTVTTGDQSAVPFAFGRLDPATAYVNVGTGAFVQRTVRDRLPEAPRLLASVVWSDGTGVDYMLEGTVNGAGSALEWFAVAEQAGIGPVLAAIADLDPGTLSPPLFLNGVGGLGSPFWRSDLAPRFIGAGPPEMRLAAVLESIAFLLKVNLDELAPHGPVLRGILLTGGLSAHDYFCRCLADVAGLPVRRSREPEATALGLGRLLAGAAAADWPAPATELVTARPDPALLARFARWRRAIDTG